MPSTPASSLALVTIVVVLMGDGDRNRQRRYLGCIFVKLYPALLPHDGQTMADLLTLADPALRWKSTSLWLVGPCRLPGGGLWAACFILVRPLQTTVSPVMVLKLRPAGPKVTGSLHEAALCPHACGSTACLGNTTYITTCWPKYSMKMSDKRAAVVKNTWHHE